MARYIAPRARGSWSSEEDAAAGLGDVSRAAGLISERRMLCSKRLPTSRIRIGRPVRTGAMGRKGTQDVLWLCPGWLVGLMSLHMLVTLAVISEGKTVKYVTYEEESPGTVIGNLAKEMSWGPLSSKTNFKMMRQLNSSFIRLRESDGQLSIGERIDREAVCRHTARCLIAFDAVGFSREQLRLIHVEVEVRDINDNSPQFPNQESAVDIFENSAVGSRIPLEVAADADVGSNYIQSYQISVNSHFSIDVLSRADGVKYAELVLMKPLDRETQSSYVLELVATDGGTPSRCGTTKIHVKVKDYNDNSPAFERSIFSVDLSEDAPAGFLLLDLDAVDPDEGSNGEVVYGFGSRASAEIRQLFKVDRKSGRLTLERQVDFEAKRTYELDVQAHDLGPNPIPSMCKVIIHVQDVNDNAPEISITPMTSSTAGIACITEAAARDSFVALISTSDSDSGPNGEVRCTLYGHDHFRLQQAYEDSYMMVTTTPLDRETIAEYNLTVVAEDLGSPPFKTVTQYTIRVGDENDNAPLFSKALFQVSMLENNAPGAYITTVIARDADAGHNGKVTYRLSDTYVMGSHVSTFVSLDPATGSIYALRSFNYEVTKQLEFRIQASDGGSPPLHSSADIRLEIVDQNDNAPAIIQPALTNGSAEILLPKDAPSGYIIVQMKARDADEGVNGDLSYKMVKGDHLMFSINKATGEIYLNREMNFDVSDSLKVLVTVSDNGRPSLTTTATLFFTITAGAPPSDRSMVKRRSEESIHWDVSTVIIAVLAGSCSLLLLAIILIATRCNRHRRGKNDGGFEDKVDLGHTENGKSSHTLISSHSGDMFDVTTYSKQSFTNLPKTDSEICSSSEDGSETSCVYESEKMTRGAKIEGYSTLPGYGKEAVRPVTIWKGNSYTTISVRDPQFSGKDSGKGDSDFNDSDSDLSGDGIKKDFQSGLWTCTTECKILGHSDRCWSPSAVRAEGAVRQGQQLSTFAKTASLPRNTVRRENYFQAHIPKTVGLQSVYEKVLRTEFEYVLSSPSPPDRCDQSSEGTIPAYTPSMPHK